jgi:DNA-binding FadR family transcriptional regulator
MPGRYQDVMRELIEAVVGGEYAEGTWMPSEPMLRERFGASRGVLREALRGLEERGLVAVHPGRGQAVRQREEWDTRAADVLRACIARGPDPAVFAQAFDARAVVEREAASRTSTGAVDGDFELLATRLADMESALSAEVSRTFDADDPFVLAEAWFHHTLAVLCGNELLATLVRPLHVPLAEHRRRTAPERDRAVLLHHRRIVEGFSSREQSLAASAIDGYARQLRRWIPADR